MEKIFTIQVYYFGTIQPSTNDNNFHYSFSFVFRKIFFLVGVFGLYHGLIFLPVALSLFGPSDSNAAVADQPSDSSESAGQRQQAANRSEPTVKLEVTPQ